VLRSEADVVPAPKKVKPNVGHSEGASGITSIIKAVLALEKKTIPPNINFLDPNPKSELLVKP
jgi:acyl transferase domain-containing protein